MVLYKLHFSKVFWTENQNNELELLANNYKEIEKPGLYFEKV